MRFLRQSLTGLFLLALTFGLLFYAGFTVKQAVDARMAREARVPQERERVFSVNVVTAQSGTVSPVLTAYGQIESRRMLEIRAAVGGEVVELADNFVEGGAVQAGQILLKIDPKNAAAALARAEADLSDAGAETRDAARALALAKDELAAAAAQTDLRTRALQRQKDLRSRGVGSDAAVETAELAESAADAAVLSRRQALAQAEARVDQAATRLARAEIDRDEASRTLGETEIRAGFSGTLSDVSVVAGRLVSPNERLAQLVDDQALEVAFRLSTRFYTRLLDDHGELSPAPVRAKLDMFGLDVVATGSLSRDSAAVGEGQTGRLVFARLDRAPGMKPGDFVTVEIDEAPMQGVTVLPSGALGPDGTVLVLGADDRLEVLPVTLELRQGDEIVVRAPALDGREVVTVRTPLLGAGIKVTPLRAGGAEAAAAEPELVELSDERRARLRAFVEANQRMPQDVKTRILAQLSQPMVPASMIERIEARMGG